MLILAIASPTPSPTAFDVTLHSEAGGPGWIEWLTIAAALLAAFISGYGIWVQRKSADQVADQVRADFFSTRYHESVSRLGDADPAVRLAGAHSIALLADDWEAQRQMCIDVLTSYFQVPYQTDENVHGHRPGERETRRNMLRIIRNHLRTGFSTETWRGSNLRFEAALFEDGDLTGAHFTRRTDGAGWVTFYGATFAGPGTMHFTDTVVDGGRLTLASSNVKAGRVSFDGVEMRKDGVLSLQDAVIDGGQVTFRGARFTGGRVDLSGLTVLDGGLTFADAVIDGSDVTFSRAGFRGGAVSFENLRLVSGSLDFEGVDDIGASISFDGFDRTGGTVTPGPFAGLIPGT